MSHLVFESAGNRLATDLDELDEVLMPARLQAVAGAPGFLLGVLELRGRSLPVIALDVQLDGPGPAQPLRRGNRILCIETGGRRCGFLVDRVLGIHAFDPSELRDEVLDDTGHPAFTGETWHYRDGRVQGFSLRRALGEDQLALLRPAATSEVHG